MGLPARALTYVLASTLHALYRHGPTYRVHLKLITLARLTVVALDDYNGGMMREAQGRCQGRCAS